MTEAKAEPAAPHQKSGIRRKRLATALFATLCLVGFSYAYLHIGRLLITQTNFTDKDILGGDQKNNIQLALQTVPDLTPDFSKGVSQPIKNWFPHRTDGVVNPLWPWIAAWMVKDSHQPSPDGVISDADRDLFNRGRHFHLGWTLGILILIGITCFRAFSAPAALNILLLVGFGALLPRTAYFQPEPLFFVLFLATWVACLLALDRNGLWIHCVIGILGGLAYLAKGSVQPLLAVYAAISTLRWAWGWIQLRLTTKESTSLWLRRNHWLGMAVMAFFFLMTAGPRMVYSERQFGDPFHSFPGYWMWFDNFEDGYAWMDAHNTKAELEAVPKSELPSFSTYRATHTNQQMVDRLIDGTKVKLGELLTPNTTLRGTKTPKPWKGVLEWRGWYLGAAASIFLFALLALKLAAPAPIHAAQRLHPESSSKALFVIGAFVGYSLAYGWYTPIGKGDRFMLSLYAPMVLSIIWASERVLRRVHRRNGPAWISNVYYAAHSLLAGAVIWRLIEIFRHPVFLND